MKLHILGGLASTMVVTSRTMRAFSLAVYASYHFVSLVLPCRLISSMNSICDWKPEKSTAVAQFDPNGQPRRLDLRAETQKSHRQKFEAARSANAPYLCRLVLCAIAVRPQIPQGDSRKDLTVDDR
eukprot:6886-Heterococcus_DN1.PRE.1